MAKKRTANKPTAKTVELQAHYDKYLAPLLDDAPWSLRITEWRDRPPPLMIVRERRTEDEHANGQHARRSVWHDRGLLCGESQRRCLPTVRSILARVLDDMQRPLELQQYVSKEGLRFRGNLPLDEEAGCKLALMFKLHERVKEQDRVELIARRIDRFTREEAAYWLSRISNFGEDANRWAVSGLKILLGGQPRDPAVERMLEQMRARY